MADLRRVTDSFSVAPQLRPEEMADLAAQGFRLVINNRPDGESPGQPSSAEVERSAREAGLDYRHIPVVGAATPDQVAAMDEAMKAAGGPAIAFCRSGTRSITTWARGQAQSGERGRDELVGLGEAAGYDLSHSV